MIESYIRKDDVIKCELDSTFIEKTDSLSSFHRSLSRRKLIDFQLSREIESVDRLSQIAVKKCFAARIIIQFLKRRETQ